jgi:hypothetical protein
VRARACRGARRPSARAELENRVAQLEEELRVRSARPITPAASRSGSVRVPVRLGRGSARNHVPRALAHAARQNAQDEVTVLKAAIDHLQAKVDEVGSPGARSLARCAEGPLVQLEKGGPRGTPARPAGGNRPVVPAAAAPSPTPPKPAARPQTAAPASSEKYGTLPKSYRTGPVADALKGGKDTPGKVAARAPRAAQPRTPRVTSEAIRAPPSRRRCPRCSSPARWTRTRRSQRPRRTSRRTASERRRRAVRRAATARPLRDKPRERAPNPRPRAGGARDRVGVSVPSGPHVKCASASSPGAQGLLRARQQEDLLRAPQRRHQG